MKKYIKPILIMIAVWAFLVLLSSSTIFRLGFLNYTPVDSATLMIMQHSEHYQVSEGNIVRISYIMVNGKPLTPKDMGNLPEGWTFSDGEMELVFANISEAPTVLYLELENVETLEVGMISDNISGFATVEFNDKRETFNLYAATVTINKHFDFKSESVWSLLGHGEALFAVMLFCACIVGIMLYLLFVRLSTRQASKTKEKDVTVMFIGKLVLLFCYLMIFFFSLISVTPMLPEGNTRRNMTEASEIIMNEGILPPIWSFPASIPADNWTNANVLLTAYILNPSVPITSAMEGAYRNILTENDNLTIDPVTSFWIETHNPANNMDNISYTRYWHGYTVGLRLFMSMFGLVSLRSLLYILNMVLFTVVIILLIRRTDALIGISFALAMTMIHFPIFATELLNGVVIICAFVAVIIQLSMSLNIRQRSVLMLVCIAAETFVDAPVAPITTYLMPMFVFILLDYYGGKIFDLRWFKNFLFLSMVWGFGFIMTWVTKWAIASVVLEADVLQDVINQITLRMSSSGAGTYGFISSEGIGFRLTAVWLNIKTILPFENLYLLIAYITFVIVYCVIFRKDMKKVSIYFVISLTGLFFIPMFWNFMTANHSTIHTRFTYRHQVTSAFILFSLPNILVPFRETHCKLNKYMQKITLKK